MDKKEINELEKQIKKTFNNIEKVKKNGVFLFKDINSEYWKCKDKYYSISLNHIDYGDVWCIEYELEDIQGYLADAKSDNESNIESAIWRVRSNSLLIKEEYEEKIRLMEVKL